MSRDTSTHTPQTSLTETRHNACTDFAHLQQSNEHKCHARCMCQRSTASRSHSREDDGPLQKRRRLEEPISHHVKHAQRVISGSLVRSNIENVTSKMGYADEPSTTHGEAVGSSTVDAATYRHEDDSEHPNVANYEVCFGMITNVEFALHETMSSLAQKGIRTILNDVTIDAHALVHRQRDNTVVGSIPITYLNVLTTLCREPSVSLQIRCIVYGKLEKVVQLKHRKQPIGDDRSGVVHVIVYGSVASFTDVGKILEDFGIFLQDPKGCYKNVRYRNPHRLSGTAEDAPMTMSEEMEALLVRRELLETSHNCLDELPFRQNLPLTPIPDALITQLFEHQRQALTFMREREHGWDSTHTRSGIWEVVREFQSFTYVNSLTGDPQPEPPRLSRGGILADGMGLGKTLTVISLVASDRESSQQSPSLMEDKSEILPCTLIVVPPTLLPTWQTQFRQHCKDGAMRIGIHHGKRRFSSKSQLAKYDVVLTSYHTISAEYRKGHMSTSVLFSMDWHRIILDEAHLIRDERSQLSKAICALRTDRRWAVTGTPLQNHVTDFIALLRFLRVHPYDEKARFEKDIISLWKIDHEAAIERFKKLILAITLRRSNTTINLPPRVDRVYYLQFNNAERDLYDFIESRARCVIESPAEVDTSQPHAWQNLNMLRSICNHGTVAATQVLSSPARVEGSQERDIYQNDISNEAVVSQFGASLDSLVSSRSPSHASTTPIPEPTTPTEGMYPGIDTNSTLYDKIELDNLNNMDQYSNVNTYTDDIVRDDSDPQQPTVIVTDTSPTSATPGAIPTKVRALVRDLQACPESKSVVFSFWSTTLDIIIGAFKKAGITYVRFDGRVTPRARNDALARFRTDEDIRVILMTISCGAVGLDITVADRAYLMEPQWNPTVEDQALARIHRLGQTKPVTTVRFIIEDSIEQRVVALQERKRGFADLLLSNDRKSSQTERFNAYRYLKSLLN